MELFCSYHSDQIGKEVVKVKADLIIKSNSIFDVIHQTPYPGYVAVKGNRIISVGKPEDAEQFADAHTVIKEFGDNTVMPGFHDSHTHFIMGGLFQTHVNLADARSEEECVQLVKDSVDRGEQTGKWILGFSWYHVFWDNQTMPSCKSLDKVFPDRPVCLIHAEAHGAWVNTAAMKIMGVTKDTPDPFGGKILRDENGEPSGVFLEAATGMATGCAFDFTKEEEKSIIHGFMEAARKYGITSINDVMPFFHGNMGDLKVYSDMDKSGELTVRIHAAPNLLGDLDEVLENRKKYSSDKLHIDHVKQFLDGVCTTHTSLLLEDYADMPGERGAGLYNLEPIREAVPEAHKRGLSIKLHSCGDGSARFALDCFEDAIKKYGPNGCRHAIEHIEVLDDSDLPRFGELGIIPSVQPEHMALTQTFAENPYPIVLGKERADKTWPLKDLYDTAGLLAIGSDCPVVDNNPFLEIYRGVTRLHNDGQPEGGWNPTQKLSLYEVLRSYTYGSAYGAFRENELGTLEEGKFADIAVIDKDLFAIDPSELIDRKVIMTVMDGNIIYEV